LGWCRAIYFVSLMLWIEIAFPHLSAWQQGAWPPPCAVHGGCSGHGFCWHPDASCVCQWINPILAPSRGQKAKNQSRLYTHTQLFEEAQSLKENKVSICLTLSEGEKRLDLPFSLGLCTQENTQVAVPDAGWVVRGPGTDPRCLPGPSEGRAKSHRETTVSYTSSSLLYKPKNTKSGGKESPNFLFFWKQSCLRVISN